METILSTKTIALTQVPRWHGSKSLATGAASYLDHMNLIDRVASIEYRWAVYEFDLPGEWEKITAENKYVFWCVSPYISRLNAGKRYFRDVCYMFSIAPFASIFHFYVSYGSIPTMLGRYLTAIMGTAN